MSWTLTIGGRDYSDQVDYSTLNFDKSIRHTGGTLSVVVVIRNKAKSRPCALEELVLSGSGVIFGGVVQEIEQRQSGPDVMEYYVRASDYVRWLDHVPVGAQGYTDMAFDQLVQTIVHDWATTGGAVLGQPGPAAPITTNHVEATGLTKFGFQGGYMTVSQTIDQLAKEVYCVWFIDEYKDLWFCLPNSTMLYAPPSSSEVTYYNQDLVGSWAKGLTTELLPLIDWDTTTTYKDMILKESASDVCSAVAVRDYYAATDAQQTENSEVNAKLTGDGQTRFFPLYNIPIDPEHTTVKVTDGDTPKSPNPFYYTTANNNLKTEYIDGQPSAPTADDWCFICTSNQGIRFNQAPPKNSDIEVIYNYYTPNAMDIQYNYSLAAEIARREGYGPGWYYQTISLGQAYVPLTLKEGTPEWLAQEYITLNRYGRIKISCQFTTYQDGWRPGQTFAIRSSLRGGSDVAYNVWGSTFSQKFYVTQVSGKAVNQGGKIEYTVEGCSDIWGA